MNETAEFKFHGYFVHVDASQRGGRWVWTYRIDRVALPCFGDLCLTAHEALEDAGMAARDHIRTMRNPTWRTLRSEGMIRVALQPFHGAGVPA